MRVDRKLGAMVTILQSEHTEAGEVCPPLVSGKPWRIGACTLTGPRHRLCEDVLLAFPVAGGGLHAALADGVSGGARGDIAAQAAVDHCIAFPPQHRARTGALAAWLDECDATVAQALAAHGPRPGATTLAAVWLDGGGKGFLAHVGDCRAYRWRPEGGLRQLTRDHSYRNLGQSPPPGISADNPARMLGLGNRGQAEVQGLEVAAGEIILLCSDGVHGVIDGSDLAQAIGRHRRYPLAILAGHIAEQARMSGSQDDIAVLLMQREG